MDERLRVSWEVNGGVVPGNMMLEFRRQFHVTSAEWQSPEGGQIYTDRLNEATEYFKSLNDPKSLNWARMDWIWY
jgi:hypothetical protein